MYTETENQWAKRKNRKKKEKWLLLLDYLSTAPNNIYHIIIYSMPQVSSTSATS